MTYTEYGKENRNVIILLHGGGLSWWNYRGEAELLQDRYHVILPVLDGHAQSGRSFTSIEDNAEAIISFIDERFGGSVFLLGGVSLGGQILLEILSRRKDICRYAIVESALVIPSELTCSMIRPAYGCCYGLIRKRWFSKLQFRYLRIRAELFEDYYRDTCGIAKSDMIAFLQANAMYSLKDSIKECNAEVMVFAGEKEIGLMRKSAEWIHGKIKNSRIHILPGLHHGEFSINHASEYVKCISDIAKKAP